MSFRLRASPFDDCLKNKQKLVGVEVGVFEGGHAIAMLINLDIKQLFLIDPYKSYPNFFGGYNEKGQELLDVSFNKAMIELAKRGFTDKVFWKIDESLNVVNDFEDESLDFVYLDGNHDYNVVSKEIPAWEKKVKIGGLVGGHDYTHKKPGVPKAVNEYVKENNIKLEVVKTDWFYWRTK